MTASRPRCRGRYRQERLFSRRELNQFQIAGRNLETLESELQQLGLEIIANQKNVRRPELPAGQKTHY